MGDRTFNSNELHEQFEYFETEDDLRSYLEEIVPSIGWIIVYFNSLEDDISKYLRAGILRDPYQDERLDIFLSEMRYAGKCRALINLYGQVISNCDVNYTQKDLTALENILIECSKRRNEYAHADWVGMAQEGYTRVKSQSKKTGLFHRYRKFDPAKIEEDIEYICASRDRLEVFHEGLYDQVYRRA